MGTILRASHERLPNASVVALEKRISGYSQNHLLELVRSMSTHAKYGWAIGLIFAGIVGALPFRNTDPSLDEKIVAQNEDLESSENEKPRAKKSPDKEDQGDGIDAKRPGQSLAQSALLPNAGKSLQQFDDQKRDNESFSDNQFSNTVRKQGPVVEQVPNRLDRSKLPLSQGAADSANATPSERPANLKPVQLDKPKVRREMPRDVGPYRMKPVPSSKFHPASQTEQRDVISNTSRTRKVVQYKLRDGDSLRSIAQRYLGDANRFEEILNDNQHILTNGESFLPIGQYITIVIQ